MSAEFGRLMTSNANEKCEAFGVCLFAQQQSQKPSEGSAMQAHQPFS